MRLRIKVKILLLHAVCFEFCLFIAYCVYSFIMCDLRRNKSGKLSIAWRKIIVKRFTETRYK